VAYATETRPIQIASRPRAAAPAPRGGATADWVAHFERIYRDASGDAGAVPWADGEPNPSLVAWLNAEAPGLVRPGATVAVVGCGLGDDVRELADRGYDVVGFDCSPTAIAWARRRHTSVADRLMVADLFSLPTSLLRRHDLVVEIHTLQAIDPCIRPAAAAGVAALARPRGSVLVIGRGRDEGDPLPDDPPYPLTCSELERLMSDQGLAPTRPLDAFVDDEDPPSLRIRGVFRRSG
jgi:SAM-dependent methyltransferase